MFFIIWRQPQSPQPTDTRSGCAHMQLKRRGPTELGPMDVLVCGAPGNLVLTCRIVQSELLQFSVEPLDDEVIGTRSRTGNLKAPSTALSRLDHHRRTRSECC